MANRFGSELISDQQMINRFGSKPVQTTNRFGSRLSPEGQPSSWDKLKKGSREFISAAIDAYSAPFKAVARVPGELHEMIPKAGIDRIPEKIPAGLKEFLDDTYLAPLNNLLETFAGGKEALQKRKAAGDISTNSS